MHHISYSMSSVALKKENIPPEEDLNKLKTGNSQHRVALSDVTSQVNNKSYPTTSSSTSLTKVQSQNGAKQINTNGDMDSETQCDEKLNLNKVKAGKVNEPLRLTRTANDEMLLKHVNKKYFRSSPDPNDEDSYDVVMVPELTNDIFPYLRSLETRLRPNPQYMQLQPHLKWTHRSTVIEWIVEVHLRFRLLPETLYLTVNIIDRFLSNQEIALNKFQLIAAAALFIASKYEEINCPTLNDIIYMLNEAYSKQDILTAERLILNVLEFELGWPGPMSFLRRVSKADDYEHETRTLAKYLLESTIMDPRLVDAEPSWLAAGSYFLSMIILGCDTWSSAHVFYSNYTYDQIFPLAKLILENCRDPSRYHKVIWEKYSHKSQHYSSQIVSNWILDASRRVEQQEPRCG
ncbi:hypothetical protein NCAS_0A14020 [Naumovozyma castellii]|uniref:Uncharacterized protein n=1 Tax=Naumovozyma castellii TaxID=27288 RepID=G0V911_NAUCA|nr:hypothetical protein NCAS_0A14020 [Naumovozyma castellii CBS 4309]CCC67960.1 hypothetical protein NCAS_0A14020 [Naumovozyma castellii CBS 4309]